MNAADSSWRTWMKRMRFSCARRDSMMPLIPSPGSPKMVSTPQAQRVSTRISAAVGEAMMRQERVDVSAVRAGQVNSKAGIANRGPTGRARGDAKRHFCDPIPPGECGKPVPASGSWSSRGMNAQQREDVCEGLRECHEVLKPARLVEVQVRAEFIGAGDILESGRSRIDANDDVTKRLLGTDRPHQFQSVHDGHLQVSQHEIRQSVSGCGFEGRLVQEIGQGLLSVAGGDDAR